MSVNSLKRMAQQAARQAKVIKECGDTPPGHDYQKPKVVDLMGKEYIVKTCTKCGMAKFYPYKE